MTIDLLSIANFEGKTLKRDGLIDLSDFSGLDFSFSSPAEVSALFSSVGGEIRLSCHVKACAKYICDRCLVPFDEVLEFDFSEILRKETPFDQDGIKNPDVIFYTGNSVELDEIVINNIFINLPSKKLCRVDCKGLCSKCGKNLNDGACGCDTRETDPRFDVLDSFF